MVKIKEGYVMNQWEKAEYDRLNALPRKTGGTVAYYFKPQTKYPPRIYVFMHAEIWCDRNRRPMGLFYTLPFLVRPMNRGEIEYHHFDTRLCYHQYENWDKLLYAEEKEAEELDKENAGSGMIFLERLRSFQRQYPLAGSVVLPPVARQHTPVQFDIELAELLAKGDSYSVAQIGQMLDEEQQGQKRTAFLILLRSFYREKAGKPKAAKPNSVEGLNRKAKQIQQRTRKNFVRRVFAANPLFALAEIRLRYEGYEESDLIADLKRKPVKPKQTKRKPVTDLRRCQLRKLAVKLAQSKDQPKAYHDICTRMAMLEEAHRLRLPILITVRLQCETKVYSFNWKTREEVVKAFVELANSQGMTHGALQTRYQEIISSNYSF